MASTATHYEVKEETTAEVGWVFQDPNEVAIASAALSSATITLYNSDDSSILNSRDDQDILGGGAGANNVSITTGGIALWVMQPADNAMVSNSLHEIHVCLIEWTWDPGDGGGDRYGKEEIRFLIKNLTRVP